MLGLLLLVVLGVVAGAVALALLQASNALPVPLVRVGRLLLLDRLAVMAQRMLERLLVDCPCVGAVVLEVLGPDEKELMTQPLVVRHYLAAVVLVL